MKPGKFTQALTYHSKEEEEFLGLKHFLEEFVAVFFYFYF